MLNYLLALFEFLVAFTHLLSFGLLLKSKPNQIFTKSQRFYLIQLSLLECVYVTSMMTTYILYHTCEKQRICSFSAHLVMYLGAVTFYIWYLGLMTLLTIDRFLAVHYNIRYSLYCTLRKTKIASFVLAILSFSSIIAFFVGIFKEVRRFSMIYIWSLFDISFLALVTVTYTYFFL